MEDDDDQPNFWVSALKVILGIATLVGGVGFALWYADQQPVRSPALEQAKEVVRQKSPDTPSAPRDSWGIVHDSPIRRK